jgi:uncharacterized membrane protein YoaK (UPF0700 family)
MRNSQVTDVADTGTNEGTGALHDEHRHVPELFIVACLFTSVGGYMDAYSYLAHGHVFANAQTANVIFFSIYVTGGQWAAAARHLPPIMAFSLGVAAAKLLGVRPRKRTFRPTLLCQAFELVVLATLAVVGADLPNASVVPIISFVAALQNTSFNMVGPWSFNSAMTTGNLRAAISGLVLWIAGRETTDNRRKACAMGMICFSFLIGALCGGIYTRLDVKHALAPCAAIVAVGFLLTWRQRRTTLFQTRLKPNAPDGSSTS